MSKSWHSSFSPEITYSFTIIDLLCSNWLRKYLYRGRPCSSYSMSPLNRGSSHRIPISILRCHTGLTGVIGVVGVLRHSGGAPRSVAVLHLDVGNLPSAATGSTTTLLVLPHGNLGFGAQNLLSSTSVPSYLHFSRFLVSALPGFWSCDRPESCAWNTSASGFDGRRSLLTTKSAFGVPSLGSGCRFFALGCNIDTQSPMGAAHRRQALK